LNYKDIYETFIYYCNNTIPRDRLYKRSPSDERLLSDKIYTEFHHVVPRHTGRGDETLVEVLPEEHIFLHSLRYKAYSERGDMLAVRQCLNGFNHFRYNNDRPILTKKIRQGYAFIRNQSYNFRKDIGWQTPEGIKRISESRKGQIPVKDILTGEMMGCVTKDHPKYISGEWVHHSKGKIITDAARIAYSKASTGENNPNFNGVSDDDIIKFARKAFDDLDIILSLPALQIYLEFTYSIIIPSPFSISILAFTKLAL
jgi:hypothetical protein